MIKKLIALVLLALILWGTYVAYALVSAPPVLRAKWGNVNEEKTEIVIRGEFQRPLLIPASLKNMTVYFTGVRVAELERFEYSPTGTNTTIVIALDNPNLIRAFVNYLDRGQQGDFEILIAGKALGFIPFSFSVKQNFTMKILDMLNFTAESQPILGGLIETPELRGTKITWMGEKRNIGILNVEMLLYNPNSFPIPVSNLSFDLWANGIKIGTGYLRESTIIPAGGYAKLNAVIFIEENELPKVWALHVRNGERSIVEVQITLSATVAGKSLKIPLKTESRTIQTHIMEDMNTALQAISGR